MALAIMDVAVVVLALALMSAVECALAVARILVLLLAPILVIHNRNIM